MTDDGVREAGNRRAEVFVQPETDAKQTIHWFAASDNADLKSLPDLPFLFGLDFRGTEVSETDLGDLKDLKNLGSLDLTFMLGKLVENSSEAVRGCSRPCAAAWLSRCFMSVR